MIPRSPTRSTIAQARRLDPCLEAHGARWLASYLAHDRLAHDLRVRGSRRRVGAGFDALGGCGFRAGMVDRGVSAERAGREIARINVLVRRPTAAAHPRIPNDRSFFMRMISTGCSLGLLFAVALAGCGDSATSGSNDGGTSGTAGGNAAGSGGSATGTGGSGTGGDVNGSGGTASGTGGSEGAAATRATSFATKARPSTARWTRREIAPASAPLAPPNARRSSVRSQHAPRPSPICAWTEKRRRTDAIPSSGRTCSRLTQ